MAAGGDFTTPSLSWAKADPIPPNLAIGSELRPLAQEASAITLAEASLFCAAVLSKGAQEVDEVLFLLIGQADAEALVVEVHDIEQRRRRPIAEIRRARCQPPQRRHR